MSTGSPSTESKSYLAARLHLTVVLGVVTCCGGLGYPLLTFLLSGRLSQGEVFHGIVSAASLILLALLIAVVLRPHLIASGIRNPTRLSGIAVLVTFVTLYIAWAVTHAVRTGWAQPIDWWPQQIFSYMASYAPFQQPNAAWRALMLSLLWIGEVLIACSLAGWAVRSERSVRWFRSGVARELPLLRRELTELSNRRRTYVVRVIGALFLLLFVLVAYEQAMFQRLQSNGSRQGFIGPAVFLGVGGTIFSKIAPVMFVAIQLLLPALCCASITAEKENNTIGTLLLTRLSPATIVLEKVASRVVPMLTILLLAFPVLAHVHSLGGVDTNLLIGTIWLLLTECFLIASIAIACSAWFATTTSAFIVSYLLIGGMTVFSLVLRNDSFMPSAIWHELYVQGNTATNNPGPPGMFQAAGGAPTSTVAGLAVVFRLTLKSWLAVFLCMLIARLVLVRRAFVTPSSILLKVFARVDSFFGWLNERTTGGIEIVKDSNPLPANDPVAWRERTKKSLGKARYLFRIFVGLEVPTLAICALAAISSSRSNFWGLFILQCLIWIMVTLIAAVKAASLFSSERARETIEPLLATPLTSAELLQQKIAGIRRLMLVLAVPVLTVNLTHFLLNFNVRRWPDLFDLGKLLLLLAAGLWGGWTLFRLAFREHAMDWSTGRRRTTIGVAILTIAGLLYVLFIDSSQAATAIRYLLISTGTAAILLSLVTWVATAVGMRIHSQTKAVLTSVGLLVTWTMAPIVVAESFWLEPGSREVLLCLSPYSLVESTERFYTGDGMFTHGYSSTDEVGERWWVATHLLMGTFVLVCRGIIYRRAPELLNRVEQQVGLPANPEPASGIVEAAV